MIAGEEQIIQKHTIRLSSNGFRQRWNGQQWRRMCDNTTCRREAQRLSLCARHQLAKHWRPQQKKQRKSFPLSKQSTHSCHQQQFKHHQYVPSTPQTSASLPDLAGSQLFMPAETYSAPRTPQSAASPLVPQNSPLALPKQAAGQLAEWSNFQCMLSNIPLTNPNTAYGAYYPNIAGNNARAISNAAASLLLQQQQPCILPALADTSMVLQHPFNQQ